MIVVESNYPTLEESVAEDFWDKTIRRHSTKGQWLAHRAYAMHNNVRPLTKEGE